jgi:hypothetical protein
MKAQEKEGSLKPSKLKATICADLMMKLCATCGKYTKVSYHILFITFTFENFTLAFMFIDYDAYTVGIAQLYIC